MYTFYFLCTFFLSLALTPLVIWCARRLNLFDRPQKQGRKIHKKSTPLGGGVVIFVAFFAALFVSQFLAESGGGTLPLRLIVAVFLGSAVIMIGGLLDDRYNFRPAVQIVFPIVASVVVIAGGVGLESITSPSGGVWYLNQIQISVEGLGRWLVVADTVVFLWLMGMMFTTKLLDGLDGLATGIALIGGAMIFFLAREPQWYQPEVALTSLLFVAACLGFLVWNFHPAKIFLGEGGSLFLGFILGILAIVSGSKIATTLLVMGLPMLDVARVIIRRLQKKKSVFLGDSEHLHFRLLSLGLSHWQTVLFFYSISFLFGITTLFLQSQAKVIALCFLFLLMLLVGVWFGRRDEQGSKDQE